MNASEQRALLDAILRKDFGTFVLKTFETVSPGDDYLHNWHIDAISYALAQVRKGATRRLIINQPPRSLKSICASVAFIAWWLGHDPSARFICVSYSSDLAATFARQFRLVTTSTWYRQIFPDVRFTKDTELECTTSLGGGRVAVPVGGSLTGRGADVIIVDDPMKADDAHSELARRSIDHWYRTTLLTRLDDRQEGAIIVVAQRLHEDDLPGRLLQEGASSWKHLNLPAIAEEDQRIQTGPDALHIRKAGEVLHPEREPMGVLEALKREMGSMAFSAQYLQRPMPLEGNLVRREWIRWCGAPPEKEPGAEIVQSWDVASTTAATSDWSVCTTWLAHKRRYHLLHVWRDRVEFPALRSAVVQLAREYKANRILIEKAGPGLHLIQELTANPHPGIPLPIGVQPEGDKLVRMEAQTARFEAGQVLLLREAVWLGDYLHELLGFPHARHDDQVDSTSQFLNWVEARHRFQTRTSLAAPIIVRAT